MFKLSFRTAGAMALVAVALASTAPAFADPILTNGSFTDSTNGVGQLGRNTDLSGWTSSGYNFLFSPDTVSTTGSDGAYGPISMWGPGNGSANGLGASPDGGNFVGMDGAFGVGPLEQTVTGLTVGQATVVSFYFAGAQQSGYDGPTTEAFLVSLGNQTQKTQVLQNDSHGFTGWQQVSMTFVPTNTSEVLQFLAVGTPDGVPPFSLLDGVSVSDAPVAAATPEPSSLLLLATGLVGSAGLLRRRISKPKE